MASNVRERKRTATGSSAVLERPAKPVKSARTPAKSGQAAYRRPRRFPETNSPYRQLRLLISGSMPRLRQALRAQLLALRSQLSELAARLHRAAEPKRNKLQTALFLAGSIAIAVFAVFQVLYTTATTVLFDGVELGTVASEEEALMARQSVERSISSVLGYDYTVEDRMSYTTGLAFRSAVVDESVLEEALNENLNVVEHGYELYVGGEFIGATQTEGAFEEIGRAHV